MVTTRTGVGIDEQPPARRQTRQNTLTTNMRSATTPSKLTSSNTRPTDDNRPLTSNHRTGSFQPLTFDQIDQQTQGQETVTLNQNQDYDSDSDSSD